MTLVTSLILRRMRKPLIVLIFAYAICIVGMVTAPGVNPDGDPWHMSFFHALYFVSYMATTIGFGEIPYEFSDMQRLWSIFAIYIGVISWFYAIGTIISLIQNHTFSRALTRGRFARTVRKSKTPFYLICGYGDTGQLLVQSLTERFRHTVVIDQDQDAIADLGLRDYHYYVPRFTGDANDPEILIDAGIQHPQCLGVIALTNSDAVNLKIAITAKLLNPNMKVICRADHKVFMDNMKSFGTNHIINPFETYADHLAMAIHAPGLHLLEEWLTGVPNSPLSEPIYPPHPEGKRWVLCSYGRFGKAIKKRLDKENIDSIVIDANEKLIKDVSPSIHGSGTQAVTLKAAGIDDAVGVVAGTDNDANNLSIIMTARDINPNLFTIMRQNHRSNDAIFRAIHANQVMQPGNIIAHRILALLTAPLLADFLKQIRHKDSVWANEVVSRVAGIVDETTPYEWVVSISPDKAEAVLPTLRMNRPVTVGDLLRNPRDRDESLRAIPLVLRREDQSILMPGNDVRLEEFDRVLFCGTSDAASSMEWILRNPNAFNYVMTGNDLPSGWLWRKLKQRRKRTAT